MKDMENVAGSIVQLEKEKTRKECKTWLLRVRTSETRIESKRFKGTYEEAEKALLRMAMDFAEDITPEFATCDLSEQECDTDSNHHIAGNIIQIEKDKPHSKCRVWQLQATSGRNRRTKRLKGTYEEAEAALRQFTAEISKEASSKHTNLGLSD